MQGHTTLLDLFGTSDFSSAQSTAHFYLNAFSSHAQRRSDRHLNGSFIVDTIFNLPGNGIGNNHGIKFGPADLEDVDLHILFSCEFFQLFFDPVNFTTAFADDDTWLRRMDGNDQFTQRALNDDLGNTAFIDAGIQVGPDFVILDQLGSKIFFIAIPVRFLSSDDA